MAWTHRGGTDSVLTLRSIDPAGASNAAIRIAIARHLQLKPLWVRS